MVKKLIAVLFALFATAAFAAGVDVNKGSQAELETVKGIGPAMSAKLIAERKKGEFKDWADMVQRVPGIGDASASKLSTAGLTVSGTKFASAPVGSGASAKLPKEAKPKTTPVNAPTVTSATSSPKGK